MRNTELGKIYEGVEISTREFPIPGIFRNGHAVEIDGMTFVFDVSIGGTSLKTQFGKKEITATWIQGHAFYGLLRRLDGEISYGPGIRLSNDRALVATCVPCGGDIRLIPCDEIPIPHEILMLEYEMAWLRKEGKKTEREEQLVVEFRAAELAGARYSHCCTTVSSRPESWVEDRKRVRYNLHRFTAEDVEKLKRLLEQA